MGAIKNAVDDIKSVADEAWAHHEGRKGEAFKDIEELYSSKDNIKSKRRHPIARHKMDKQFKKAQKAQRKVNKLKKEVSKEATLLGLVKLSSVDKAKKLREIERLEEKIEKRRDRIYDINF